MIFFPAIDLKNGQCVRLLRGQMDQATVFNDNPAAQAAAFMDEGSEWLHLVDLNGAVAGCPVNAVAVRCILGAINIPVQLGGGIRDMATIEMWLDAGVRRVILGTAAVRDPDLVHEACRRHPSRVALSIDAHDGRVAVAGWAETSELEVFDLARRFEDAGAAVIIYTDISRDGTMEGPNVAATVDLATAISTPVIASGGVSSIDDLQALKAAGGSFLEGVISGRAVYEGRIDVGAAVALLKEAA